MAEKEDKVQKYLRIPIRDKDHKFMKCLSESMQRSSLSRVRECVIVILDKIRAGKGI